MNNLKLTSVFPTLENQKWVSNNLRIWTDEDLLVKFNETFSLDLTMSMFVLWIKVMGMSLGRDNKKRFPFNEADWVAAIKDVKDKNPKYDKAKVWSVVESMSDRDGVRFEAELGKFNTVCKNNEISFKKTK